MKFNLLTKPVFFAAAYVSSITSAFSDTVLLKDKVDAIAYSLFNSPTYEQYSGERANNMMISSLADKGIVRLFDNNHNRKWDKGDELVFDYLIDTRKFSFSPNSTGFKSIEKWYIDSFVDSDGVMDLDSLMDDIKRQVTDAYQRVK